MQSPLTLRGEGQSKGISVGLCSLIARNIKNFGMPKNRKEKFFMKTAQSAKIIMGGGTVNLALVTLTKMQGSTKLST